MNVTEREPDAADLIEIVAEQVCDDGAQIRQFAIRVDDPTRLVDLIARVEGAKAAVNEALEALKRAAVDAFDEHGLRSVHHPDHDKPMKITRPAKRSTDWRTIMFRIGARCADEASNLETGEMEPIAVTCQRVIDSVMAVAPLTPSKAPREPALRARGIEPDEVVSKTWGDRSVRWDEKA